MNIRARCIVAYRRTSSWRPGKSGPKEYYLPRRRKIGRWRNVAEIQESLRSQFIQVVAKHLDMYTCLSVNHFSCALFIIVVILSKSSYSNHLFYYLIYCSTIEGENYKKCSSCFTIMIVFITNLSKYYDKNWQCKYMRKLCPTFLLFESRTSKDLKPISRLLNPIISDINSFKSLQFSRKLGILKKTRKMTCNIIARNYCTLKSIAIRVELLLTLLYNVI